MPYESTNLNNFKNSQNEFKLSLMKKKKTTKQRIRFNIRWFDYGFWFEIKNLMLKYLIFAFR